MDMNNEMWKTTMGRENRELLKMNFPMSYLTRVADLSCWTDFSKCQGTFPRNGIYVAQTGV